CEQRQVAAKLDYIPQTLLGMYQQRLACERLDPVPAWRAEMSRRVAERRHLEARLVERPSQGEFAARPIEERESELGGRVMRFVSQCAAEARSRFAMTPENLENNPYVGLVLGSRAAQHRRADETLERLRRPPCRREGDAPVVQHPGGV